MPVFTEKLMYIWQSNWHLIPWGVLFCLLARINSSSIFGRRVLFLGLYLINGMDNGLEDGMVYGMEHWESKFTVFDALLLLAL